jgi:hypothetical protein
MARRPSGVRSPDAAPSINAKLSVAPTRLDPTVVDLVISDGGINDLNALHNGPDLFRGRAGKDLLGQQVDGSLQLQQYRSDQDGKIPVCSAEYTLKHNLNGTSYQPAYGD